MLGLEGAHTRSRHVDTLAATVAKLVLEVRLAARETYGAVCLITLENCTPALAL